MVMYMSKLTNKEVLGMVVVALGTIEHEHKDLMVDTVTKMIEQITHKAENKKLTKAQQENETIKEKLLNHLQTTGEGMNISQLQQVVGFSEYSNQKLSALLNQLVKSEVLVKAVGTDRKTTFSAVEKIQSLDEEFEKEMQE